MAELQAACRLQWEDAATVQAATRLQWEDAATIQSIGSPYTKPPAPPGATVVVGGLAPRVNIPAQVSYDMTHSLAVVDSRTGGPALQVKSVNIELSDGSDLWTLRAEADGSAYSTLTTGDQPPTVKVTLNGASWSFVIESIDAPQAFASSAVTFGGRSLAAVADAPYQAPQQWITDAPTTAAQLATIAQTFTGLDVRWLAPDWLIPAGAWSYSGSPLDVVREVAKAIGAVVEAAADGVGVSVRSRYPVLPNAWATTGPDWQISWLAIDRSTYTAADTPEYNAVYVAGQQQGGVLNARYAGTSGAVQAPMVTDPLLTDLPGLVERATAVLAASGKQARVSRTLQVGSQGVVPRGSLVRFVDPDETWTGMVRSVSVEASFARARQTITVERRTAFQAGLFVPPPPPPPPATPDFDLVVLQLHMDGSNGSTSFVDTSKYGHTVSSVSAVGSGLVTISATGSKFGDGGGLFVAANESYLQPPVLAIWNMAAVNFTVECWIKPTAVAGLQLLVSTRPPGTTGIDAGFHWFMTGSGLRFFFWDDANAVCADMTAASSLTAGVHQHVAVTRNGSAFRLFINGVELASATSSAAIGYSETLRIGHDAQVAGRCFDGVMDDLRITKGLARYTANFTPPTVAFPNA